MGATRHAAGRRPVGEAVFAEGYGMVETGGRRGRPGLAADACRRRSAGPWACRCPATRSRWSTTTATRSPSGAVGELLAHRARACSRGTTASPEATAGALTDDGWLRTGDLARRGPLGIVNFEGRMKDVIKRGGYSVYAVEVEQALEEHPDVLEAAVVPVPDDRDGEVPVAAVRLAAGRRPSSRSTCRRGPPSA